MKRFKRAVYPQIRINLIIIILMIGLCVWQRDFIVSGIEANVYLNTIIFFGSLFGVILNFYNLSTLKAEFIALDVLREAFDDTRAAAEPGARRLAAAKRRMRLNSPAKVYGPVRLMNHPMSLLLAQVYRHGDTRIPSSSALSLVSDLHSRVSEKISLSNYIAGLMVLLGLLGTFIGLLTTVGSVGDVISSLNVSGGAGSAAIQTLLEKLEIPLGGMATGFSSSLFGLIGSLTLGVMSKISARADKTLKRDFEAWLGRVAQFERLNEDPRVELDAALETSEEGGGAMAATRALLRIARASVVSNAQLTQRLDRLVDGYTALERESGRMRTIQTEMTDRLERSLNTQVDLLKIVRASYENQEEPLVRMSAAIERMEERLIREHGRARELLTQQSRSLVLQADQAAQRSVQAIQSLGEQTRTLKQSIDVIGVSVPEAVGKAVSKALEATAASPNNTTEQRAVEKPQLSAQAASVLENATTEANTDWAFSIDSNEQLTTGSDWENAAAYEAHSSDTFSEEKTYSVRSETDRRQKDRRRPDPRHQERRAPKYQEEEDQDQSNNVESAEVAKWMLEISADDFEDSDSDMLDAAQAGKRRPIA